MSAKQRGLDSPKKHRKPFFWEWNASKPTDLEALLYMIRVLFRLEVLQNHRVSILKRVQWLGCFGGTPPMTKRKPTVKPQQNRLPKLWQHDLSTWKPMAFGLLGGSSHLVSGLVHPNYKWINPTYPIYNWGYNPLTKWDEPPSTMI